MARRSPKPSPAAPPRSPSIWPVFAALLILALAVYYPVWHGGPLWDDDAHVTRGDLQSLHGLWRIWFDLGATQQYYPIVHSAFWVLHRLWGDDPLGYHLVNIVLHATSTTLLVALLRRLAIPGALLAGLIFALHPIEVESVAWITELKNTLSGVLYLSAALLYLRYDTARERRWYFWAFGLFLLALFSKTVTATLPAALLVVFWWQRGRLRWREDVTPLLPFFAAGVAGGLLTAWVERVQIGAEGTAFAFTPIERVLIAGRALWFYLGKLLWPTNLVFIYPRWHLDAHAWWQYAFPAGAVLVFAGLWLWRKRSRAPLAAALFFAGTLFPALGFVNVYPFLYSFVADHFQYLAGLGVIVPVAAGLTLLARRTALRPVVATAALAVVLGVPAAALTWQQSHEYGDAETLYRKTLDGNPECWMAWVNLGKLRQEGWRHDPANTGLLEEAVVQFREALRLKPDLSQGHNNLGTILLDLGRTDEAEAEFQEALRLKPSDAEVRHNLSLTRQKRGDALQSSGRLIEAAAAYRLALTLDPNDPEAHHNLGTALARMGRLDEAITEYLETIRLNPSSTKARRNLAFALLRLGRRDEALERLREAVRIDASAAGPHLDLATVLDELGRPAEAATEFREALARNPALAEAANGLGVALAEQGQFRDAADAFRQALAIKPDYADARTNLQRALALIKHP